MTLDDYRQSYLKDIQGTGPLAGKRIVLAITGSIAAVECPRLARELMRLGADVHVCMSRAARRIITDEAMCWATGNPVVTRLTGWVEHLYLAGEWKGTADLVLIAPATANTIGKMAHGIDDTVVTTLATTAIGGGRPVVVAPGMHAVMARHPAFAENLQRLRAWGVVVVAPHVAEGKAKMAAVSDIIAAVVDTLTKSDPHASPSHAAGRRDLTGQHVLITAGPTVEYIDPVRVLTNQSSGKMGVALATAALQQGADVTMVYGPGTAAPPPGAHVVRVTTTAEMERATLEAIERDRPSLCILAAAPCDFGPARTADHKIATRNGSWSLELAPTPKILASVRAATRATVVAFKAETVDDDDALVRIARQSMEESGADFTVANHVGGGRGFLVDDNEVYVLSREGRQIHVPRASKQIVAEQILDTVLCSSREQSEA